MSLNRRQFSISESLISESSQNGFVANEIRMNAQLNFRGYGTLRFITLMIMCMLLCISAYSQDTPDFASPSSMTFDFVQRKSSDMLAEDVVSSGKMAFIAPDRIRWEYLAPYSSLFVMNGARVLVENVGGRKVMDAKSSGAYSRISRLVLPLIRGDFQAADSRDFRVSVTDGGDCWRVELVPLRSGVGRLFRRVVAEVDKKLGVAVRLTIDEGNGDTTLISCANIVLDAQVDERLFEF